MNDNPFAKDVDTFGSYAYTLAHSLSARLSNERVTKAIHQGTDFRGKTVLDIGCGDGAYTIEYVESGAASVLAIDPVENAVRAAAEKYRHMPNLVFKCQDLYALTVAEKYDIAIIRGVLHHTPDMPRSIEVACRVAKEVIVMEPNGYNPVLKIIEKVSPYHIEHKERSFFPYVLRKEFAKNGGVLSSGEYVGLVPFFCPDWFARLLKFFEPVIEKIPLVKQLACGQYIIHVQVRQ